MEDGSCLPRMSKLKYLNIGCGAKFHPDWFNVDMASNSPYVIAHNVLKGLPFDDDSLEVVYLSQVLGHFPKEKAAEVVKSCYRVLKHGGFIRVVTPDLEGLAKQYLNFLLQNINNPTEESKLNYEWILLEMFDEAMRNQKGGEMAKYLRQQRIVNEGFVFSRIGLIGRNIRNNYLQSQQKGNSQQQDSSIITMIRKACNPKNWSRIASLARLRTINFILTDEEQQYFEIGKFRLSGEVHYRMYDRYSLYNLLESTGFREINVKTPFDSEIPNWGKYELDVKEGEIYDPGSLFMEAKK